MEPTIENFLYFEKKNKCNQIEIEGMHVWALYRYEIHNAIKAQTVGRTEETEAAFTKKELITMALNALKPFMYRNVDVLFVGNGRRTKNPDTGVYEDIYCDEIAKKYNSVILEHPENHGHCQPNGMNNVYFTDRVAFETNIAVKLSKKLNTPKRQRRTEEVKAKLAPIFDELKKEFGPDLKDKLIPEIVDRMYYIDVTKKYCGKILDKARPKLIIEICYYAMECYAMNMLGHERGIPTAEYSHGFAFPTHTPMQYNPEDHLNELPDYELVYSETQLPIVNLPGNVKMRTVGFPFFEKQRAHYQSANPKNDKTICFISTLTEGEEISKVAARTAELLGDEYHIIYKLHPKEFGYYKERYPWLNTPKLDVIDNGENHIFKYLAESAVVVSTRTASVWEGIGFGCKTILLNFGDTVVNMEYFIKEKNVPIVDTAEEVVDLIKTDSAGYVEPDGMFEPNAMHNICEFIDEVIKK
ncbi:hypothetical protein SAMN02910384_01720 [Pseudobutyrivibrio sp. ACV-2]|uniref:hypothetical protein n=1 Tax=Pseudobutyrivibrio sp. ACV-2 TaxID=1520801 RepID=UPI0008956E37|nr:hypothetical protein [Pseudobutyrivibrio sp. ACV-2]SEA52330.1 hypothetical protein SAMN02910384_01720 [Pseudobutyrivibrio sp. ACV-2]